MSTANQSQLSLTPVVVEQQVLDLVRVEKSLHSLGFFASTAAAHENSRTVMQVIRRADGQRIQAKAVIEGIPSLGLPTTADRDKYMAFMKIALDQREAAGILTNPVRFTGADMIKLLRLRKGGFHYDEINDWCKRMVATTIMSESSIYLADRRQYVSDAFHVFDRVVLVGEELADGSRAESYQVFLSHWQLSNLNQGYIFPLDFNAYLSLRRDIAKALFGHLSVWFYASRGQAVEKKYGDLCQLLHIRAYPHVSKAKAVLEPSIKELIDIGYLSDWEFTRTATPGEFKIMLTPGTRLLLLPHFAPVVNAQARASLEASLPSWVQELVRRGVTERRARQLALEIPHSQPVSDQIEYVDHLIALDRKERGRIANPAGLYVWAIQEDLSVPGEFETSGRRQKKELLQQAEEDERARRCRVEVDYEEFCRREVRRTMDAEFPGERLNVALREHMRVLKREQPDWFQRVPEAIRREVALSRLETKLRETLALPSLEQWAKQNTQRSMF